MLALAILHCPLLNFIRKYRCSPIFEIINNILQFWGDYKLYKQ